MPDIHWRIGEDKDQEIIVRTASPRIMGMCEDQVQFPQAKI
jgi:hypothetical protein